jgi:hypothetical protein
MATTLTNNDGAINRFYSQMRRADGFARLARYQVILTPPKKLEERYREGLLLEYTRGLSLMCDSVTMPGKDLKTGPVKHGQELTREQVQSHVYEGTITATFYLEHNLLAKAFFEAWQDTAVRNGSNNVGYYDDYVGGMDIYQLSSAPSTSTTITKREDVSGGSGDHRTSANSHGMEEEVINSHVPIQTHGVRVEEVFPATIGQIDYAYATANELARLSVEFQYKSWHTIDPDEYVGYL